MLKTEFISPGQAWLPDADTLSSFQGGYRPCRVHGPARLMRFLAGCGQAPEGHIYGPSRLDGSFWFDEQDFLRIRRQAEADLKAQGHQLGTSLKALVGLYMRHQFRSLLAVRRDWTGNFDFYSVLAIPPQASVISLAGKVREQPVYSEGVPGEVAAREAGIKLEGGLKQYVIRFEFPANQNARKWIQSPRPF